MEAKALLIHPPHQGVCGRHGTEEQRVTSGGLTGSLGGDRSKQTYKRERNGERCPVSRLRKVWKEIQSGREWIVDADLKDFFGSVDHEKLLTLVSQRIAGGRVLRLIEAMLKAGSYGQGNCFQPSAGLRKAG